MIASFRHLDAVYKIDKSTGAIVWKLGGTSRPESLTVIGIHARYTFGGQHDARLLPDGTLTVFDNRTNLGYDTPRAVRFRIDETDRNRDAAAVDQRPARPASHCCGSARRLGNGDWLIDWGAGHEPPDRRLQAQWPEDLPLDLRRAAPAIGRSRFPPARSRRRVCVKP